MPSDPPQFSISLQNRGLLARPETLLPLAERVDAAGYDAIWVTDHVAIPRRPASRYPNSASGQPPWPPDVDYLEPLTTLAYLAARTRRARVGTSVLVVPVRPPLVVAKMLASLDVLSGGRLIVGVGTGWLAEEFEALGVPFARRGARTDGTVPTMSRSLAARRRLDRVRARLDRAGVGRRLARRASRGAGVGAAGRGSLRAALLQPRLIAWAGAKPANASISKRGRGRAIDRPAVSRVMT